MQEPDDMAGVREAILEPPPGQCFVTMAIGNEPAYTVASIASPNRCTLIIVTLDEDGQPKVDQYLLPIGHLIGYLDPHVQQSLHYRNMYRNPLQDVYKLTLLGRAFRKRRNIANEFRDADLQDLLYGKWLDPIGAALAAYECARRSPTDGRLPEVAGNMEKYFADLPDTAAIQRLARYKRADPTGVPLFIDGLRAFENYEALLPFPAGLLDFSGPWTAWRGALRS
jgi:hypothetical protein